MKQQMLEEYEAVEKVKVPKKESFFRSVWKYIRAQPAYKLMHSAFADPITILLRSFWVKKVDKGIIPGASWFDIQPENPSRKAVLLCHGFANSPAMFRDVAPQIAAQGYYVRTIRLAGHGTSPGHLAQTTGTDWFSSVVWHYKEIKNHYEDIYFVGHSLGGTLGIILSTIYPIKKLVTIAAPIKLKIPPAKLARPGSILIKYWPRSRKKRKMIDESGEIMYKISPLYATAGVFDVSEVARNRAEKLTTPTLYIKAGLDNKAFQNQESEFESYFPKTRKEVKIAEESGHSVFRHKETDQILQWIHHWFSEDRPSTTG